MDQLLEDVTTSSIVIGGHVTVGGNSTSDYTSGITNTDQATDFNFVTLDLQQLPASAIQALEAGTAKFELTFTTSTNSRIERTLHVYAGDELPAIASEIANPSKSNASAAYNALLNDGTAGSNSVLNLNGSSQVTTINIRDGLSPFSSDENQNATQTIDLTTQAIDAIEDGTPLQVWFAADGMLVNEHLTVNQLSATVTGLIPEPSSPSVTGPGIVVTAAPIAPFAGLTLSSTVPQDYLPDSSGNITLPYEQDNGESTAFIDQSVALVGTDTYLIVQSNAAAGTLSGPGLTLSPFSLKAGQVGYLITGTAATITAAIQALTFTPSSVAGAAGTTFTIDEYNALVAGPAGAPQPIASNVITVVPTTDTNDVIPLGTTELVESGGTTVGNTLGAKFEESATEQVGSGGTARTTTVQGGLLDVQSGGQSFGTIVSTVRLYNYDSEQYQVLSGQELVENGGLSTGADVMSGGVQVVSAGGIAESATIEAGGTQNVYGLSDKATVDGTQTVYKGQAIGSTVGANGVQLVEANANVTSTTVLDGGSLTVMSGGHATGIIIAGGSVVVQNGAQVADDITFSGLGSLEFDAPVTSGRIANPVTIFGLQAGDYIDLAGFAYLPGSTVTLASNQLTVTNGVATETIRLDHSAAQTVVLQDDGAGGIALQVPISNTTGGGNATPAAPTIQGGGNISTHQAAMPFQGVQVIDTNAASTETVTIQVSGAGASGVLSGQGLAGGAGGTYTLAGSAATVTGELRQLTFTFTSPQPNSSVTTGFTLTDVTSFGKSATDTGYSISLVTKAAVPVLQGGYAGMVVSDAPASPFLTASVIDPNANSTETLTIGLSGGPGVLSGAGLTTPGGVYTLTGTAAQVTAALQALVFTPLAGTPNSATKTTFRLTDTTTPGLSFISTAFTVTDTDPAVAPTISGTAALTGQSEATSTPFATAMLTDPNVNSTDVLTITLSGGAGVLSGPGLTAPGGVYTLSGTAAQVTAALQALVFTPAAGGPGYVAKTTFTLSDTTTPGTTATSAAFSVTDTDPAAAPTLSGAASLAVLSEATSTPFATATLIDPNVNSTDVLTITLSGGAGVLSGPGLTRPGGVYTISGTAAQVTAALQALVFTPAVGAPGTAATTIFTVSDTTTSGTTASTSAFSVTDTDPFKLVVTGALLNAGTVSNTLIDATAPGSHTVLAGSGSGNTITFGAGGGTVSGTGTGDTVLGGNGVFSISGLGGGSHLTLGDGNDVVNLAASGVGNVVVTGNGNNRIAAGNGGSEQVTVGNGVNTISAGGANDVVRTGNGGDTVTLTGAGGSVMTGAGDDVITVAGGGGAMIRAGLGMNRISFVGTGNTLVNQGGSDTLTDSGSGNTIVLGVVGAGAGAGAGLVTVDARTLSNGDTFDLRTTMAATAWDHTAGTLSNFLMVGTQGSNATIVVDPTGLPGGAASTVAVITGAAPLTLAALLPHTLT